MTTAIDFGIDFTKIGPAVGERLPSGEMRMVPAVAHDGGSPHVL